METNGSGELNGFVDNREIATIEDLIQDTSERQSNYEPIELENGKIVVVRPLNRKEALRFKGNRKMARDVFEQRLVAVAMVSPKMTAAQVAKWQLSDRAGGDLYKITNKILALSGMKEVVEDSKRGVNEDIDSDL